MAETVIVITTIHVPEFIQGICKNIRKNEQTASILVIGDVKTPSGVRQYCAKQAETFDIEIEYLDIEGQKKALTDYPKLLNLFPLNTPDRIILGCMLSYIRGCKRIIAVDDDNFMTDSDFVGYHSIVGTEVAVNQYENEVGWFNVHTALLEEHDIPFYPRGYPWSKRVPEANEAIYHTRKSKVIVNQGLVLGDPDIDAITRLAVPINATGMKRWYQPQFGLKHGVWSPFNFQNTCLSREMIPFYYRPRSGKRNADIWTAYLFNKLAEANEGTITFGHPLVRQERNVHDLWEDLDLELINNKATDYFVELLRNTKFCYGKGHLYPLGELIDEMLKGLVKIEIPIQEYGMINDFLEEYQVWCDVVDKIE